MGSCFPIEIKRCGIDCCHKYFVLKVRRKYGIIKAWKNIDGAVGNTNVCRVNNGLQPINKRLKEQLIVTAMKKRRLQAAPAIKQVAHGRCLGRRHGRLILPCRFSVFICFCLCCCAFLRNLLSLRYFCSRRHGFQGVGAFMFYVVFVTRLPGCSISGVSRVNSCSVSAGFQVFLKQSFHFLRIGGIDDADTGIVDVDVLMPHAVNLPRFMYHDP